MSDRQDLKIDMLFIRHGLSCTNVIKRYSTLIHQLKRLVYTDPQVTHFGAIDIESVSNSGIFPKPDLVISSCLLRAIETADLLFNNGQSKYYQSIVVAPFIKELGPTAGNQPGTIRSQEKKLKKRFGGSAHVHYDLVRNYPKSNVFSDNCYISNYPQFQIWLERSLPYIMALNNIGWERKKITIAVVTHSNFMKKYLPSVQKDKPYHVGTRKLQFAYNRHTLKLSREPQKTIETYRPFKGKRTAPPGEEYADVETPEQDGILFFGFPEPTKIDFVSFEGDRNCRFKV
jgi:broad specificity phosphatase PhoE